MKNRILLECLRIAEKAMPNHPDKKGYRHFCFIIQDNKILGVGYNRVSEPLIGYPSYGKLHAEPDAYKQCKGIINKDKPWSAVNIRLAKSGGIRISKPCPCCYAFLERLGCKEIWFTTKVGFAKIIF